MIKVTEVALGIKFEDIKYTTIYLDEKSIYKMFAIKFNSWSEKEYPYFTAIVPNNTIDSDTIYVKETPEEINDLITKMKQSIE